MDIKNLSKDIQDEIIFWRRELHQIPEIGFDLPKTMTFVSEQLTNMGIESNKNIVDSGVVGIIHGSKNGPTVAIRSDMDALNIKEETGLDFSSKHDGNMHACGHDAHMAITLGAAKILQENREEIQGNIKLIFQPAEEGPGGAKPMIKNGVLKNPDVKAIIGFHIGQIFDELENGQVGIKNGPTMACLDSFKIEIIGKGGHGAKPNKSIDPVVISASIIQDIQTLISRELSPVSPGVISICKIKGGTSYNIIPDKVILEGTARFINSSDRQRISNRFKEFLNGVSSSRNVEIKFSYNYGYPPLINNKKLTNSFKDIAKEIIEEDIIELNSPTMVGEDMAYFLNEIPGVYFFLGGINKNKDGKAYSHHSSRFDVDESVFWIGTSLLVKTVIDWLSNNEKVF